MDDPRWCLLCASIKGRPERAGPRGELDLEMTPLPVAMETNAMSGWVVCVGEEWIGWCEGGVRRCLCLIDEPKCLSTVDTFGMRIENFTLGITKNICSGFRIGLEHPLKAEGVIARQEQRLQTWYLIDTHLSIMGTGPTASAVEDKTTNPDMIILNCVDKIKHYGTFFFGQWEHLKLKKSRVKPLNLVLPSRKALLQDSIYYA